MAVEIFKTIRFVAFLVRLLATVVPYEIVRSILVLPFGRRYLAVKTWPRSLDLKVRIIRSSLDLACSYKTWNATDWHMAALLKKKSDRVKLDRWSAFENQGLLQGPQRLDSSMREDAKSGQIDALWYHPKPIDAKVNEEKVIMYLHGGGYVVQFYDDIMYCQLNARQAKSFKRKLFTVDYRASATEPFPYGLQDAISGYRYLVQDKGYKAKNITLMGDSAGANLTLATLQYIMLRGGEEKGLPLPGSVLLISPWCDLTLSATREPSILVHASTDYIPLSMGMSGATQQSRTKPEEYDRRAHPFISPLYGDFSSLKGKPIQFHITYGTVEFLSSEIVKFVDKLRAEIGQNQVNVALFKDMAHDHQLVFPELPESEEAFQAQANWFEQVDKVLAGEAMADSISNSKAFELV